MPQHGLSHVTLCRLHGLFISIFKADDLSCFAEETREIPKLPYELVYTNTRNMEIFSMETGPILPGKETPTASESAENLYYERCGMEIDGLDRVYVKVSRICLVVFLVLT